MGIQSNTNGSAQSPCAVFIGDLNVGKSSLINALLRRDLLYTGREESRAYPTFLARGPREEASYSGLYSAGGYKAHKQDEFLATRRGDGEAAYAALGARLPDSPFARLVLVDTAGTSTDSVESVNITAIPAAAPVFVVLVADIEYWNAKHTLEFIAHHSRVFAGRLIVAANKADHLNLVDIRKVCEKAPSRMQNAGINPVPPFVALSSRLELARRTPDHEYRMRTKREVREWCDAGFDALRVALYEFESQHTIAPATAEFDQLLGMPLAQQLIHTLGGVVS